MFPGSIPVVGNGAFQEKDEIQVVINMSCPDVHF